MLAAEEYEQGLRGRKTRRSTRYFTKTYERILLQSMASSLRFRGKEGDARGRGGEKGEDRAQQWGMGKKRLLRH